MPIGGGGGGLYFLLAYWLLGDFPARVTFPAVYFN